MEKEKVREKEPEAGAKGNYEETLRMYQEAREKARTGKIVIKAKEQNWHQSRMGYTKHFLRWQEPGDAALDDWTCFIHHIKVHSGKHRHQGGIMLYVLEGEGYTTMDGKRMDWEKGDLIVIPVKPDGVEHQHFNRVPGKDAKWMAFLYQPFFSVLGNVFEHVEDSPDYKKQT